MIEYTVGQKIKVAFYWGIVNCTIIFIESECENAPGAAPMYFIYLQSEYEDDNIHHDPKIGAAPYFTVMEYNKLCECDIT